MKLNSIRVLTIVVVLLLFGAAARVVFAQQQDVDAAPALYLPLIRAETGSNATVTPAPPTPTPTRTPTPLPTPDFVPVLANVVRAEVAGAEALAPSDQCLVDVPDDEPVVQAAENAAPTDFCPIPGSYWAMLVRENGQQTNIGFGGYSAPYEREVWKSNPTEFDLEMPRIETADIIKFDASVGGYITDTGLFDGSGPFVAIKITPGEDNTLTAAQTEPSIFAKADFAQAFKALVQAGNDMRASLSGATPFFENFSYAPKTLSTCGVTEAVWIPTGKMDVWSFGGLMLFEGNFLNPTVAGCMGNHRWMSTANLMQVAVYTIAVGAYRDGPPTGGRLHITTEGVYVLTWTAAGGVMYYGVKVINAVGQLRFAPTIFLIIPEEMLKPCFTDSQGRRVCEITSNQLVR